MEFTAVFLASTLDPIKIIASTILAFLIYYKKYRLSALWISAIIAGIAMWVSGNTIFPRDLIFINLTSVVVLTAVIAATLYRFGLFVGAVSGLALTSCSVLAVYVAIQNTNRSHMLPIHEAQVASNSNERRADPDAPVQKPRFYMAGPSVYEAGGAEREWIHRRSSYGYLPMFDTDTQANQMHRTGR